MKEREYYNTWSFLINSDGISLDDIQEICKVIKEDGYESDVKYTSTQKIENNRLRFSYETRVYNNESLIIMHKYKRKETTKKIIFKNKYYNTIT